METANSPLQQYLRQVEEDWGTYCRTRQRMRMSAAKFGIALRDARTSHPQYRKLNRISKELGIDPKYGGERIVELESGISTDLTLAWRVIALLEEEEAPERTARFPDAWTVDPDYPLEDWVYHVKNDETRLGYIDWVLNEQEIKAMEDAQDAEGEEE